MHKGLYELWESVFLFPSPEHCQYLEASVYITKPVFILFLSWPWEQFLQHSQQSEVRLGMDAAQPLKYKCLPGQALPIAVTLSA